jgi:hypothetical protein
MRILLTDKAGLTAYLRFPFEHHGRVRHSNFIERCFGETKRRNQGHRSIPRRGQRHQPGLGGARPRLGRLARPHHDTGRHPTGARPTPITPRPTPQTATVSRSSICGRGGSCLSHSVASTRASRRPPVSVGGSNCVRSPSPTHPPSRRWSATHTRLVWARLTRSVTYPQPTPLRGQGASVSAA